MLPTILQLKHIARNLSQRLHRVSIGIIGGYHGSNLGDMALGASIAEVLKTTDKSSGLQTIYNLEKWPETSFAIVGGGAVGYNDSLIRVAERYVNRYDKVALLGVDFMEEHYHDKCLDLIRGAAYVSGRSKQQATRLKEVTGRDDIYYHPDIAFSLFSKKFQKNTHNIQKKEGKKLLVNLVPLYASIKEGKIQPIEKYRKERPELFENFQVMHDSYKTAIRSLVRNALKDGFVVETIPFTPQDAEYGRLLLSGLNVKHSVYHSDPLKMYNNISSSDWVVGTRFHATIFALKAGVRLTPVAYATKNELMLEELNVHRASFLSTVDLAKGVNIFPDSFLYDQDVIKSWETKSRHAINTCIDLLKV